jgi:aspartyl-tRNA(Asn)/glutamyl-tRNA(Gln) amidotransferase subunit B
MIRNPSANALQLAEQMNLLQESDSDYILPIADKVLLEFEEKVKEYRKGKKGLLALFVGEVMKRSKGKADPVKVNDILLEKLKS